MDTCFVMQPFDDGPFDKRFDDVIEPAIKDAGLEPYRIDDDPQVEIPIDEIEKGILNSKICLAEITTNNPNVWFELGYAIARNKRVVLLCSNDRKEKFPFDIQHRSIIKYSTDSRSDFDDLKKKITKKAKAYIEKENTESSSLASNQDDVIVNSSIEDFEIEILGTIVSNAIGEIDRVASEYSIADNMRELGFRDTAIAIGLKGLESKGLVESKVVQDYNGEYRGYAITDKGYSWLSENKDKFQLRDDEIQEFDQTQPGGVEGSSDEEETFEPDDELPF